MELEFRRHAALRSRQKTKQKTDLMKIFKKFTFEIVAAALLLQIPITRADDHAKAVPPSNQFVVLLEGTFQSFSVVPDLGLMMPNLGNGRYKTVPMYNIESGVPGPTDKAVGNFYTLGGEMLFVYDLIKGAMTAMMIPETSVTQTTSDGAGGIVISGTYELDILEANGIYQSFEGGHIHMVDVLQITATGLFVEHCFCFISKEHGKP
jgi:hypothetical protein